MRRLWGLLRYEEDRERINRMIKARSWVGKVKRVGQRFSSTINKTSKCSALGKLSKRKAPPAKRVSTSPVQIQQNPTSSRENILAPGSWLLALPGGFPILSVSSGGAASGKM